MIIDKWQHLRRGEGTVTDYVTKFDDLMIRCNLDEEPMATLARFRAGLRPEFQRELVLQEVSTLEKEYRYAINMELFSSPTPRSYSPWIATTEVTHRVHSGSGGSLPTPLPLLNLPPVPSPSPSQTFILVQAPSPTANPVSITSSLRGPRQVSRQPESAPPTPLRATVNPRGRPLGECDHDCLQPTHPAQERGSPVTSVRAGDTSPSSVRLQDRRLNQHAPCW